MIDNISYIGSHDNIYIVSMARTFSLPGPQCCHTLRHTPSTAFSLAPSSKGRKDVVNQCLEFDTETARRLHGGRLTIPATSGTINYKSTTADTTESGPRHVTLRRHGAETILMISRRCPFSTVTLKTATLYAGATMCQTTTSSPVR